MDAKGNCKIILHAVQKEIHSSAISNLSLFLSLSPSLDFGLKQGMLGIVVCCHSDSYLVQLISCALDESAQCSLFLRASQSIPAFLIGFHCE